MECRFLETYRTYIVRYFLLNRFESGVNSPLNNYPHPYITYTEYCTCSVSEGPSGFGYGNPLQPIPSYLELAGSIIPYSDK